MRKNGCYDRKSRGIQNRTSGKKDTCCQWRWFILTRENLTSGKKSLSPRNFPTSFPYKRPFYCTVTVPYPATASCSMSSVGSTLQWGVHEVRLHEATTLYQSFSRAAVPCLPVTSHHPPTTHHPHRCASRTCHMPQPRPSSCCSTRASARAEALGQSQS